MIHKIEVVAAIIMFKDEILCMRRGAGKYPYLSYKYEFPGGKIEEGETRTEALKRELREEMDFDTVVNDEDYFMTVEHNYPDFDIRMHCFMCKTESRDFVMREHCDYRWLRRNGLLTLDWAAADLPVVEKLISFDLQEKK